MRKNTEREKIKQVNPHNELIKSLPDVDYIQNPILYSQICGNFSLMQTNIMLSLISSIKEKISDHIVEGKGLVGPLFTEEELKDDLVFRIPLMSLGVDTNQYKDVEAAGKAIIKLDCTYHHTDENGNRVKTTSNIFGDFTIPDDPDKNGNPRKRGYIELTMRGKIANQIFNTSNQYVEHIADIAKICHSPRTPRLYVYLSAWRKSKSEILLTYDAVKEYLGMLEYDKGHNKITNDKCTRYALFHRDVLTPAQKELKKLAKQGKVEFYFEYEPKYATHKTRGVNPSHLLFRLIPTECIMDETEELEIADIKPMYYRSQTEDYRILCKLREAGNQWAAECLAGKIPYDDNYIAHMKALEESYRK